MISYEALSSHVIPHVAVSFDISFHVAVSSHVSSHVSLNCVSAMSCDLCHLDSYQVASEIRICDLQCTN